METKVWNMLDNAAYKFGRMCRHGNGKVRVNLAIIFIIGMLIYPFIKM